MESSTVLIVGGSLVGLSQAVFLARCGVKTVLVERRGRVASHPRARGLNPRTMELFEQVGVADRLRATESARALAHNSGIVVATTLAGPEITRLERSYFMDTDADYSECTPSAWCLCHQDEAEAVLAEDARRLGVDLRFDTELCEFEQDARGVTATLRDVRTKEERQFRCAYLVAADGASSGVRERLGIAENGAGALGHFLNISFRSDLRSVLRDRRFVMCYLNALETRAALLPVNNADRWLLHVACPPEEASSKTTAECVEMVRGAVGVPGLEVTIESAIPWESAGRVAERFQKGRVFLVGDAAHVMPPSGAFGSNTGIQDAHNLAWKLAAVHLGGAGAELLETYDAERRPVAARTVEQAVLRSADRPRVVAGDQEDGGAPILPDTEVIFGYGYPAASRAPHVPLERAGEPISTIDLFGRGFVLLTGFLEDAWGDAARAAARDTGVELTVYQVAEPDGRGRARSDGVADPSGRWRDAYGIGEDGAVLVRPDGFVCWRSGGAAAGDEQGVLTDALTTLTHQAQVAWSSR